MMAWLPEAAAQSLESATEARQSLRAYPIQSSIEIDARLEENAWQEAAMASGFKQSEPHEGAPASQRTEVRVLYGPNNLYVGAMLYDDAPDQIEQTLGRRDEMNRADWFIVSIDSYFDQRTAFVFGVNAAGVQFDAIRTGSGGPGGGMDESWNAIWASNARRYAQGWVVEMRIPYSMLRFAKLSEQKWGIHFEREIPRLGEEVQWPLVLRSDRANQVARYGLLQGLTDIEPRRNVQVQPYTVSKLLTHEDSEQPGSIATERAFDLGGDFKVGARIQCDAGPYHQS